MDIFEENKLVLFLIFVIPGFISIKVYELLFPNLDRDSSKKLIDAISYSCINYSFLLIPIILVQNSNLKENNISIYYLFYLFVFFIFPIILVLIWKKIRMLEVFQKHVQHPTSKPWDFVFGQRKSYWLKVTLVNGTIVGGKYSNNSFASGYPAKEQIYLEESWIINDDGGFERVKNRTDGILIMQNRISYIEFRKYEEE